MKGGTCRRIRAHLTNHRVYDEMNRTKMAINLPQQTMKKLRQSPGSK